MPKDAIQKTPGLRLGSLQIENYKKLDSLEIEFPKPRMPGDLDIFALGSKNGGGKTSVLECSSLLFLGALVGESRLHHIDSETLSDIGDLLIKSGKESAGITGTFERGKKHCKVEIRINRKKALTAKVTGDAAILRTEENSRRFLEAAGIEHALVSILAISSEPLILDPLLHFNSYRKVQEANPELGMMAEDYPYSRIVRWQRPSMRRFVSTVSSFKLEILRSMMGQASLFENFDKQTSEGVLDQLNSLLEYYAGGRIERLRPLPDNKVDFRIKPTGEMDSFAFDGLSSGQKEIISTLFLIWKHSRKDSALVFIDEPELHLNAEWHGDFIHELRKLAPQNQYIVATHSEDIFRSVDETRRALLLPDADHSMK